VNWRVLLEKIDFLPLQRRHLPRCAMPPVNLLSSIAVKEIFESVLPLQNDFLVCAILFQWVHR
jgi:hypothetical protein